MKGWFMYKILTWSNCWIEVLFLDVEKGVSLDNDNGYGRPSPIPEGVLKKMVSGGIMAGYETDPARTWENLRARGHEILKVINQAIDWSDDAKHAVGAGRVIWYGDGDYNVVVLGKSSKNPLCYYRKGEEVWVSRLEDHYIRHSPARSEYSHSVEVEMQVDGDPPRGISKPAFVEEGLKSAFKVAQATGVELHRVQLALDNVGKVSQVIVHRVPY